MEILLEPVDRTHAGCAAKSLSNPRMGGSLLICPIFLQYQASHIIIIVCSSFQSPGYQNTQIIFPLTSCYVPRPVSCLETRISIACENIRFKQDNESAWFWTTENKKIIVAYRARLALRWSQGLYDSPDEGRFVGHDLVEGRDGSQEARLWSWQVD